MENRIETIKGCIDLMEASGTNVFFRFTTSDGKSGKTDVMSPASARSFLETADFLGTVFSYIQMEREENF